MSSNPGENKGHLTAVEQARAAYRECQQISADIRTRQREVYERLAGADLPNMMLNRPATEHYLGSPDPDLRKAALYILKEHWGLRPDLANALQRLAFEDSDHVVRGLALLYLVECFRSTNDAGIGRLMAGVVRDPSFSLEFRTTGYVGLFVLRGVPSGLWPHTWSTGFHFPEDVDWRFVDSFG
jgi:hypothetical protein